MGLKRILTVAGTRPEAVKLAPLVRLLARHPQLHHWFVATGQHGAAFDAALAPFDVVADGHFDLPNPGGDAFADRLRQEMPDLLRAHRPDLVLVQGDTSSAWATALACAEAGVPIGHVEAGLRSGNPLLPWPEERNRIEIDAVATLLFAPSEAAAANLIGLPGAVYVTGNTGIDALLEIRDRHPPTLHEPREKLIVVTCHRREAIPRLADIAHGLRTLAERPDVQIVLPVHGNPAIGEPLRALLRGVPRVMLTDPLPYAELVRLLDQAHLLLTDSGGLQEEAPALGLPTLVLRDNSERPEPIASGNARLVGLAPARIVREAKRLLDDPAAHAAMARPSFPYGRGDAAPRIVEAIAGWLGLPGGTVHEAPLRLNYR